jgi:hypothetical protein
MTPGNKKPVEVKRDQDSIVTVLDYLADAAEGLASETGDFLMSALDLVNPLPNDSQTAGTTIASNK